jgi:hypothetical protein
VWVLTGFAIALLSAIAFVWVEGHRRDPMLPLSFFRNRTFTSATLVGWLINIAYYGLIFVLSLYFQQIKGDTALKTGLVFLPMTAVVLIANCLRAAWPNGSACDSRCLLDKCCLQWAVSHCLEFRPSRPTWSVQCSCWRLEPGSELRFHL